MNVINDTNVYLSYCPLLISFYLCLPAVSTNALSGSPLAEETAKKDKHGIKLSEAMACISRGAPVSDCKPAPIVESKEPIRMTHSFGHAMLAIANFPSTDWPNLKEGKFIRWIYQSLKNELLMSSKIIKRTCLSLEGNHKCQRRRANKLNKLWM